MGKKLMGGLRLEIKFKYYVEITEQIKSLLSGCHGLPQTTRLMKIIVLLVIVLDLHFIIREPLMHYSRIFIR